MNFKKLLALLLISVLVFTGCTSGNETTEPETSETETTVETEGAEEGTEATEGDVVTELTEPVEITFWHGMSGGQEETLTSLTDKFMAENPDIKVSLQNQGNYGDLSQKLIATMQSPNNLPTITQAYPDWVLPMVSEGLLVDLDPYINNADEEFAFDNWDDILEGLRQGVVIDGVTYGIPFNKSTEVIWYNKTLMDELGLAIPTTYEELAEVSKQIYEAKGIPGVGFDSLSNFYTTYLYNKGINYDSSLDVTGPESLEAANYHMDGIKEGYFRIAGTDKYLSGPFANEQLAMYIGSNAGESYVSDGAADKFEYAAAPYPADSSIQQGTDIYMFESATPEQRTAAYLFLKYLTNTESQIDWALGTGYMPIRTSSIENERYQSSESKIVPILAEATDNLYTKPLVPGSQQAYNDVGTMLEGLLSSPDNNVEEALGNFKATFDSAWQQ